jgi:hypothetical protein
VTGAPSADAGVAAAQQWRADHSLRSDAAWVESVRGPQPGASTWAYPVTADEDAELQSRNPAETIFESVRGYADRFPGTFAGMWVDQSARGRLTVAFTADVERRRRELRRLVGSDDDLAVVSAKTPLAELERLNAEISASGPSRDLASSWGIRVDIGAVFIGLHVRDQSSVRTVSERFAGRPICIEGPAPTPGRVAPGSWKS